MKKALILNYHLIDNKKYNFDAFGGIYAIEKSVFEQQIALLNERKVKVVSLDDILNNKVKEDFCVSITVDDGNPSDYDIVFPVLKQFAYTATFFLCIQNMENNGVTWAKYREMMECGFDIGSHGITHRDLTKLTIHEINKELAQSKSIIEKNIGKSICYFSLPFGMYNHKIMNLTKEIGYKAILTTQFKLVQPSVNPFVINRWSIKRNTPISDFDLITQNNKNRTMKHQFFSSVKKFIISGIGTSLTNRIYTFKNKHF